MNDVKRITPANRSTIGVQQYRWNGHAHKTDRHKEGCTIRGVLNNEDVRMQICPG
jgi:hypothetical protein